LLGVKPSSGACSKNASLALDQNDLLPLMNVRDSDRGLHLARNIFAQMTYRKLQATPDPLLYHLPEPGTSCVCRSMSPGPSARPAGTGGRGQFPPPGGHGTQVARVAIAGDITSRAHASPTAPTRPPTGSAIGSPAGCQYASDHQAQRRVRVPRRAQAEPGATAGTHPSILATIAKTFSAGGRLRGGSLPAPLLCCITGSYPWDRRS
jgi:hypothetical protein